ncbi:MAG: glutamate-5-semialdehyde dehydrogenase [Pyrinomonadaceae bacterium]|nr:glutamate-5-semialdehyde dehydrogenase [Acidobacteriota bacterium]MBP7474229.1 glutamate-5-semialdehyde dehydrogenase [Pyrinomonadaceae bacterium]MBP9109458.1 glutamate-5-semialdehyde dehydrogenase [Pyrinomonadaceae bacterium]
MNANKRNKILASLARLLQEHKAAIITANQIDVDDCPSGDAVILDRLKVDEAKVDAMIASVESVIAAHDPVGRVISTHTRQDGLRIENRQVPFGTILIIYEARPDVTIEAAIIALKAGNKILLKGGKESRNTNLCLAKIWRRALRENDVDIETVQYFDISREETQELVRGKYEKFDLVIPRGGEALIDFVLRNSTAPVIVSGRGNNFLYIDREADFEMALNIIVNGKQRLSVCNALDKILINQDLPDLKEKVSHLIAALREQNIEVIGDEEIVDMDPTVDPIEDEDVWFEEFLSAKIVIGIVASTQEAIDTINDYSGGHSAAIVTTNGETAEEFLNAVDCAAVYHNASTRFTDGGQFGLGAEIAISTQKLHFRGPLGAEHLLTNKWFVFGDGHIRG